MHINIQQNQAEYTEKELLHLQQCYQCQEDIKSLEELKKSAELIQVIVPGELNWQAIKQRTSHKQKIVIKPKKHSARSLIVQQIMGIAASTFFLAVGWLVWNNYQLQSQLEQVLMVNQSLELQLFENTSPTFHQASVLNKVRNIELKLSQSKNVEEKLSLLNKRKSLIQEIVNTQEESDDAISI
jgi:hypothetical protein